MLMETPTFSFSEKTHQKLNSGHIIYENTRSAECTGLRKLHTKGLKKFFLVGRIVTFDLLNEIFNTMKKVFDNSTFFTKNDGWEIRNDQSKLQSKSGVRNLVPLWSSIILLNFKVTPLKYFGLRKVFSFFFLLFYPLNAFLQTQVVTLTSGSSWTVPSGVYNLTVECWGAGGGGGGSNSAGQPAGGGGGGAYAKKNTFLVSPGSIIEYQIGTGGPGGGGNNNGTDGTSTWFSSPSVVLAAGGQGGRHPNQTPSGNGGSGGLAVNSVGDMRFSGGNGGSRGGTGNCAGCAAGGGGSGSGSTTNGNAGANGGNSGNNASLGGINVVEFGGRGGIGVGSGGNGLGGSNFGSGGGGAKRPQIGLTSRSGGAGAQGLIRITYCIAPSEVSAGADLTVCDGNSVTLNGSATAYSGNVQLLYQDFENNSVLPWTINSTGTAAAGFLVRDSPFSTVSGNVGNSGSPYMLVADGDASTAASVTTFTSPSFSTVSYTTLSLSFRHHYNDRDAGDFARVQVSTDGTAWTNVQSYTTDQGALTNFSTASLNLNAYVGNATLYVRFRYENNNDYYWMIDDIVVSGNTSLSTNYLWTPATGLSNVNIANPVANPSETTTYTLVASHGSCSAPQDQVTVFAQTPTGDPDLFGNNTWNVYGYDGDNTNLASNFYRGYYVQPDLGGGNYGVNTQNFWSNGNSPSDAGVAINTGNIWNGCAVAPNSHTVVHKRKGFPCGTYHLNMVDWDDETHVYIDGVEVWSCATWSGAGNCPTGNIGMFMLDGDSELEIRSFEQSGGSNVNLEILDVAPTELSVNGSTRTCRVSGGNSLVFFKDENGRVIAAVNPQNQDLGYVTMTSYVDLASISAPACSDPNPQYETSLMKRHWVIDKTNSLTTGPIDVLLPFTDVELNALISSSGSNSNQNDNVNTINDVVLSKYHGPDNVNGNVLDNCQNAGGNANTTLHNQVLSGPFSNYFSSMGSSRYTIFTVPDFSEFWLHGSVNNSPLPIELIAFNANCNEAGDEVKVDWVTASEHNSSHFVLERSTDGSNWENKNVTAAAGNSTVIQQYEFIDTDVRGYENIYYRLLQYDYDGAVETYSTIMSNCSSDDAVFMTFPNPSVDAFTVVVNDELLNGANTLTISDASGKVIYSIAIELENGSGSFALEGLDLPAGLYYLQLNNGSHTSRVIKHSFR